MFTKVSIDQQGDRTMKVAIYARVSSVAQDVDLSISAQIKALREFANKNGYQIIREFIDEAESGCTDSRPEFRNMINMAHAKEKPFEGILVWKFSRFARSRKDSIVYKTLLRKNGVQVVSINEPSEDTPTGRLLEGIIESLDEFYSDNLGQEVSRGMKESVSRGFYIARKPPYGYCKVKVKDSDHERTKLALDPAQAEVVKSIYNDTLAGIGVIDIVRRLNAQSVPSPKGKGWNKSGLHCILSNEIFTGTMVWGTAAKRMSEPLRIPNYCPAIVDTETFDKVQKLIAGRAPKICHPRVTTSRFLLSGLTKCGHCGKALVGQDAKSGRFSYYVCGSLSKKGAGACNAKYLNAPRFEAIVLDKIRTLILNEERIRELVTMVNNDLNANLVSQKEQLNSVKLQIADIQNRLDGLYEAIELRQFDMEDLKPRILRHKSTMDQLMACKTDLETQLNQNWTPEISPEILRAYIDDFLALLEEGTVAEKRAFIRGFIKQLTVVDGNATLEYTLPLASSTLSLKETNDGVLSFEQYGGR
ncbi:resolvase domain protein [Dehalogenimonas sp. WBC-2]|nr:resolvase domain protein [Dehalogenimonas sp. WBC-2]